jgi:hypothetical protein
MPAEQRKARPEVEIRSGAARVPGVEKRVQYLERCRVLERELNPGQVPIGCNQREFAWQYRAFRERLDEYGRLIDRLGELPELRPGDTEHRLMRVERAIHVSLEYFQNAFERSRHGGDDDEDRD